MSCAWYAQHGKPCSNPAPDRPTWPTPGAVDGLALCRQHSDKLKSWDIRPPYFHEPPSWIYFLFNRSMHQIKIGRSTTPAKRQSDLETQAGVRYELLALIPESDDLHEYLAHGYTRNLRILGEWFEANDALFGWIEKLKVYAERLANSEVGP